MFKCLAGQLRNETLPAFTDHVSSFLMHKINFMNFRNSSVILEDFRCFDHFLSKVTEKLFKNN